MLVWTWKSALRFILDLQKETLLNPSKNWVHTCKSCFMPAVTHVLWNGWGSPSMALHNLLKKVWPGATTLHAKFRCPKISCNSLSETVFLPNRQLNRAFSSLSFLSGRCQAWIRVFNSMPQNINKVEGPSVFSSASGNPSSRDLSWKDSDINLHCPDLLSLKK